MKAKKPKKSKNLATTLAIAFLVLSMAILIIAGSFEIYFNFRTQREIVAGRQQIIAEEAANAVAGFIQVKFSLLEAATRLGNLALISRNNQKRILARLLGLQPAFRQIALLDSKEQVVVKISRLSQAASGNLKERIKNEAFSQVEEGNRYIGSVYVDDVTNEPLVVIASPVKGIFGEFQGTLMAEVNLKFMWDLVDRLKIGKKGLAYVVDRQGDLIAFGDIARVLQGQNLSHLKDVNEFINSQSPVDETRADISTGINGTTIVGTFVPLGAPDWAVVIELPVSEAYGEVIRGIVISVAFILVVAMLAGVTGVLVARRLADPLLDLTETAARIAGGEIGLRAIIKGPAEVASLARAFNDMTGQLHEMLRKEEERSRKLQQEIAQRIHAEEALKKSEERYRLLVEKMNEGLGVMDANRVMTYINDKLCQMIAYSKEEIIGRTLTDFFDEENQNILKEQVEMRRKGEASSYELEWTGKDGRKIPTIISSTPLYTPDGSFNGSLAVVTDITERKQAEAALRESEERFRDVVENIKEVFWLFDLAEQEVIYVSPAYEKIWGRSIQDLYTRYDEWADSIHPDDREFAAESFARILETGGGEPREYRIVRPDGITRWISDTGVTVTGKNGRVKRIAGVADDITERKQMEEALRQSEKRYRNIFETVSVSLWEEDLSRLRSAIDDLRSQGVQNFSRYLEENPQFVIQALDLVEVSDVNNETLKLYGAKDKIEMLGSLHKVFTEESLPVFQKELIALAEGRTEFQAEGVNQTLQGERRHVLLRMNLPDEKEEFNNLLVSITDITDRKRAEDELQRYREHLEDLVKERTLELEIAQEELLKRERLAVLGQLTATVSHELRNPLGTIRSSNFYLQRKVNVQDEKILKHFSRIDEQVARCDTIVEELLEYTRGRHVDTVKAAINPWLDELLDQLLESGNIKISRNFSQEPSEVFYDQEKMRRVIVNVIDNAIQSVNAQKQECNSQGVAYQPEIWLTTNSGDDGFRIEIEDNGIGMERQTLERAFEPLYTTRARGTGLGLANVRKIIAEHGGSVTIDSNPGQGAKVIIILPRKI